MSIPLHEAEEKLRRSVYVRQKRFEQPPHQSIFDAPSAVESCPLRHVSTVPLQALYLLNDDFVLDRARQLARRVFEQAGMQTPPQIETAFRLALGRSPDTEEVSFALEFFTGIESALPDGSMLASHGVNAQAKPDRPPLALVQFCHSLLNLNEFICLQ